MSKNIQKPGGTPLQQPKKTDQTQKTEQQKVPESDVKKMESAMKGEKKETKKEKESPVFKKGGEIHETLKKGVSREELTGLKAGEQAGALAGQKAGTAGPLGQSVQEVGKAGPTGKVQEMVELAAKMTDSIMASDAKLNAGKEVRMTFGKANPNLQGVEVRITKEGGNLNIEFTGAQEPLNYVRQNQESLNNSLKSRLDVDIRIDIRREDADTGGQDRKSKGEYIPEESEPES